MSSKNEAPDILLPLVMRDMSRWDLAQVMRLERLGFSNPWTPQKMRGLVRHDRSRFIVLEHATRLYRPRSLLRWRAQRLLTGYLGYVNYGEKALILSIAVDPEWKGRKLGELLFWAALRDLRQSSAATVNAQVRKSNEAARGLYAKYGFDVANELEGFYAAPAENALDMKLVLADHAHESAFEAFAAIIPERFALTDRL